MFLIFRLVFRFSLFINSTSNALYINQLKMTEVSVETCFVNLRVLSFKLNITILARYKSFIILSLLMLYKRFTDCLFDLCYICLLFSKTFFSMTKKPGTWLSTTIRRGNETITLHSTLHKWAKARDHPVGVSDSCLGAMCNPTCPEILKFVDTATDWGEVLNGVVLCMSLFFTVACVVAKFCFVSQLALLKRSRRHYLEEHSKCSQVKVFTSPTFSYMY